MGPTQESKLIAKIWEKIYKKKRLAMLIVILLFIFLLVIIIIIAILAAGYLRCDSIEFLTEFDKHRTVATYDKRLSVSF